MTFLNPLVLLGLIAAGIPLLIHLFQFQRPKTVDFSSIAFVKALEESTMRRMRVKRWLLLALRTLAIVSLVLAFARPTLTGQVASTFGGQANSSAALIIDNSLSMTLRNSGGGHLEQAKEAAREVVEQMESEDELFVGVTSGASSGVDRYTTRSTALERIDQISAQSGAEPIVRSVMQAAARLQEASYPNREIYIFSDLQRTSLTDSLDNSLPEDMQLSLIPVNTESRANVAVTDVRVVSRILEVGQPIEMQATLANYGTEPLEEYVASVFLEGDRVAQATATLEPGTEETVSFTVTPQHRGWLGGRIEIEEDAFEYDNQREFTVHVPEQRNVLLVRGANQSTSYLDLVFSPELTSGQGAFAAETIDEQALPARSLEDVDLVALVGVQDFSSGEIETLTRYVRNGGGVLFFPAQQAAAADYNDWFSQLNAGTFTGFTGSLGAQEPIASTERTDLEHPMFENMFASSFSREERRVEQVLVSFAMNYNPGRGNEQTLIYLSNGNPFLHEIRHGQGRMLLTAVAPDRAWSDLPVRGLFVPLMYRAAYYLSAGSDAEQVAYTLGSDEELQISGRGGETPYRLISQAGEEVIPEQRTLHGRTRIALDELREPGLYDLRQGDQLVRRLAVNMQVAESNLRVLPPQEAAEQLQQAFGHSVQVYENPDDRSAASLGETVRHQRFGVELWNVFLLIALACLAGEMVLTKRKPAKQPVVGERQLS